MRVNKNGQKPSRTRGKNDDDVEGAMTNSPNFNKHVLVVDDNETNREIAAGLLKNFGCTVNIAENGQEAVEMVTANYYDLILMDCQMPVMDGFKATVAIRRLEKSRELQKNTPIFAISGNIREQDRDKCHAAGMNGFVAKPFNQEDFRTILENVFNAPGTKIEIRVANASSREILR